jgi:heptaprenyl diphosphate synthase
MKNTAVKKTVDLAILLALGVILNIAEGLIGFIAVIPGVKLGIANTINLITLALYGPIEFLLIGLLRVILVGSFSGFGTGFMLSLSGFILSSLGVLILYFINVNSLYGLSLMSATLHGVGQVIVIAIIYQNAAMLYYVYIMLFSGIITGLIIAFLSKVILKRLFKFFKEVNYE